MIEVFRTNVEYRAEAKRLVNELEKSFRGCKINFDIDDCDRILRVDAGHRIVPSARLIDWFSDRGYRVEVLPDE